MTAASPVLSYLAQLVKVLVPGSRWFLLVATTAAAILLFRSGARGRAVGRALLAIVIGCYWLMSLPAVADAIQPADQELSVASAAAGPNAAIVVLSAGVQTYRVGDEQIAVLMPQSAYNVLAGAALYRRMGTPWVVVSGGIAQGSTGRVREADVLAPLLREHGVPEDRLVIEASSETTYAQAVNVAQLAKRRGFGQLIIVTSPAHLRRAVDAFRSLGADAIGHPARFRSDRPESAPRWLPSRDALGVAQDAIYDRLGWVYYRSRGWLGNGFR